MIQIEAILDAITTRKDGGLKLVFVTNEVSAIEGASFMEMRNGFGWLLFAPERIAESTLPPEPAKSDIKRRSQSQRLRATLFRLWEQERPAIDFETFYITKMDSIIEWVKTKLV